MWIDYNYSGIDDKWKTVPTISDGAHGEVRHNLAEGKQICFRIRTDNPDYRTRRSYGTRPRSPRE